MRSLSFRESQGDNDILQASLCSISITNRIKAPGLSRKWRNPYSNLLYSPHPQHTVNPVQLLKALLRHALVEVYKGIGIGAS